MSSTLCYKSATLHFVCGESRRKEKKIWFNITNHTCSASPHSSLPLHAASCVVLQRKTALWSIPVIGIQHDLTARSPTMLHLPLKPING